MAANAMPTLTRRSDPDARQETWHVHYGDIRVGTISERVGNPTSTAHWQLSCGFYPGAHPRECTHGTAASFEEARARRSKRMVYLARRPHRGRFRDVPKP
jgi:hypothetical protein